MPILYIILTILALLLLLNIFLTLKAGRKVSNGELAEFKSWLEQLTANLKETEKNLKDEFVINRKESGDSSRDLRTELGNQLYAFSKTSSDQMGNLTKSNEEKLEAIRKTFEDKLSDFQLNRAC